MTSLISCQIRAMGSEIGPSSERRDLSVGGWRRLGTCRVVVGYLRGKKKREIEALRCHSVIECCLWNPLAINLDELPWPKGSSLSSPHPPELFICPLGRMLGSHGCCSRLPNHSLLLVIEDSNPGEAGLCQHLMSEMSNPWLSDSHKKCDNRFRKLWEYTHTYTLVKMVASL